MKAFQTILLAVFVVMAIAGLIVFATFRGSESTDNTRIVLWGTYPESYFSELIQDASTAGIKNINIQYVEKKESSFDQELVEAIASGKGPDAIILPDDLILRYADKITIIPYTTLSQTDFKNTYAQIGEMYLTDSGIMALPLSVDPYLMYWNRNIFNTAGKTNPPVYWDDVTNLTALLSNVDAKTKSIAKSTIAFGEYRNVTYAKDMLAMLMLQAGAKMISKNNNGYSAELNNDNNSVYSSAASALIFYTDFSNSTKSVYSWNRALPYDRSQFLGDDLALYFAPASEYEQLASDNPNLNFSAAMMPQKRVTNYPLTFAKMTGLAILKSSPNQAAAYKNLSILTSNTGASLWAKVSSQTPVRRDLLSAIPEDYVKALSYKSALISATWLDPNGQKTDVYFRDAIESVTTGKTTPSEAVVRLNDQLDLLLVKKNN